VHGFAAARRRPTDDQDRGRNERETTIRWPDVRLTHGGLDEFLCIIPVRQQHFRKPFAYAC